MPKVNGLNLPFGIDPVNALPVDSNYGPYSSLAQAKSSVSLALRYDGLTVMITGSGEYWWRATDLTDNGLIPKANTSLTYSFVPYIGATMSVNIGTQSLIAGNLLIGSASSLNKRTLRVGEGSSFVDIGEVVGSFPGLWFQQASPSSTNYTFASDGIDTLFNNQSSLQFRFNNSPQLAIVNQTVGTTSQDFMSLIPSNYSPSSVIEHRTFRINARTRTYNGSGIISNNRENLIESTTYASTGAVTISNAYGLYVNSPIASTGVTISNNYSAGFAGRVAITETLNIGSGTIGNGTTLNISTGLDPKNADIWLSSLANSRIFFNNDTTSVQWTLQNNVAGLGPLLDEFSIGTDRQNPSAAIFRIKTDGTVTVEGKLRVNDGTQLSGYVLTTDNNGLASWQAPIIGASGSFVPYTGATNSVNIGTYSITAGSYQSGTDVYFTRNSGSGGAGGPIADPSIFIYSDLSATQYFNYQNWFLPGAVAGGTSLPFWVVTPANTAQSASVNTPGVRFDSGSRQWSNGNINLQEEFLVTGPVYSHISGSNTIGTASTLNVYPPTTTGGFTTITNNYAAIFNGVISATSFKRVGGTSSQFLKADGSVDSQSYLTASAFNSYVPYIGANSSVNLNTQNLIASRIIGGSVALSKITFQSTTASGTLTASAFEFLGGNNGANPIMIAYNNGNINIGNTVSTNQRLVRIGQDTSSIDIGSVVGLTSNAAIYFNTAAPSLTNYALRGDTGGNTFINGGQVFLVTTGSTRAILTNQRFEFSGLALGTGTYSPYSFTVPQLNSQLAGANRPSFIVYGGIKNWNVGALPVQYFNHWTANILGFAGPSTATTVVANYFEKTIFGSNSTITNNYGIGTNGPILIADGTQAAGYVLTSDANGGSSWQPTALVGGVYVPYTGATNSVNIGTYSITAGSFIMTGGSSTQFLKADGSIDSNTYITASALIPYIPYVGATNSVDLNSQQLIPRGGGNNILNVAVGYEALIANTAGVANVAVGHQALRNNTSSSNSAFGIFSMFSNTTGGNNVAIGDASMYYNTSGIQNTALGKASLTLNTTGISNTAIGFRSMDQSGTNSNYNVGVGAYTLYSTSGDRNTAIGYNSGSNTTGSGNLFLGAFAGAYSTTESNVFYLNNTDRSSLANDRSRSLMYGIFGNTPQDQYLNINATTTINAGGINTFNFGPYAGFSGIPAMYISQVTPSNTNYTVLSDGVFNVFNSPTTFIYRSNNVTLYQGNSEPTNINGGLHQFLGASTSTPSIANLNIPLFLIDSSSIQWTSGTISTQDILFINGSQYSGVSSTTIIDSYGLRSKAATAGTNMNIINNWAAGFEGNIKVTGSASISTLSGSGTRMVVADANGFLLTQTIPSGGASGSFVPYIGATATVDINTQRLNTGTLYVNGGATNSTGLGRARFTQDGMNVDIGAAYSGSVASIWMGTTNSNDNWVLAGDGADVWVNSPSASGKIRLVTGNSVANLLIRGVQSGSFAQAGFDFKPPIRLNSIATHNYPNYNFGSEITQWATGSIVNNYEFLMNSPTWTAVGGSTMSDGYTLFVAEPTAGTNMTITRKWAAGFSGSVSILGSLKIGTASTGGYVWTATDTIGNGSWQPQTGGNGVPYTGATNSVTIGTYSITAGSFIRTGGTSSQFLKADGSIDSNTYLTASAIVTPTLDQVAAAGNSLSTINNINWISGSPNYSATMNMNYATGHINTSITQLSTGYFINVRQRASDLSFLIQTNNVPTGNTIYSQSPNQITFNGTNATFPGVQYVSDYSANYTSRSLIDKEYADTTYLNSLSASTFVPYTGATGSVNLGSNDLTALSLLTADGPILGGMFSQVADNATFIATVTNHPLYFLTNNSATAFAIDSITGSFATFNPVFPLSNTAQVSIIGGGNNTTLSIRDNLDTTTLFSISRTGDMLLVGTASITTLSGSGTRMVVADSIGNLSTQTIPSGGASGSFVPYTGATNSVTLGTYSITAGSFIRTGGTSTQFLKADGSIDSNTYLTSSTSISINPTEIAFGSSASSLTSSADVIYNNSTLTVKRSTVGPSAMFYNEAYSLGNSDSAVIIKNGTSSGSGNNGQFGLGYNDFTNTSLNYPCIYGTTINNGLYIIGTGLYGVYIGSPNQNSVSYPHQGLNVQGKVRIGDGQYNTGNHLQVKGNGWFSDVVAFGHEVTGSAYVDIVGSTNSIPSLLIRQGSSTSSITSPINGTIINNGTDIWSYLNGTWQKLNNDSLVGYLTASALIPYVPYTGATSSVTLGTYSITAGSASFGNLVSINNGSYNITLRDLVGLTSAATLYMNQASPAVDNFTLTVEASGDTTLNSKFGLVGINAVGKQAMYMNSIANVFKNTSNVFQPTAATSGSVANLSVVTPNNTGQSASTNISGVVFTSGSRQWLNGDITLQEEFKITGPVYSHVSGSNVIGTASTLNVYSPSTTGGFTTITNNYAAIFNGNIKATNAIHLSGATPSIYATNDIVFYNNSTEVFRVTSYGSVYSKGAKSFGSNTAYGDYALFNNVGSNRNAAFGEATLGALTNSAASNSAFGYQTLRFLVNGNSNSAFGDTALNQLRNGGSNIAFGVQAGVNLLDGNYNTFLGTDAGYSLTNSFANTLIGSNAMNSNVGGVQNTVIGALTFINAVGNNNIVIGYNTATTVTTGSNNTIIGTSIVGLTSSLSNNIILADGVGNIKYQWDGSTNNINGKLKVNDGGANNNLFVQAHPLSSLFTGIWLGTNSVTGDNYTIVSDGSSTYLQAQTFTGSLALTKGNGSYFINMDGDRSGVSAPTTTFRTSVRANIPVGANPGGYSFTYHGGYQWQGGPIPEFFGFRVTPPVLTATSASVLSAAYNMYVEAPTAGTNMTITESFAAGFIGKIRIYDGTQNNGYVLTSDAGGGASWQPPSGGGGSVGVPYTGATNSVVLGTYSITAASIIKSGGTSAQFLKADGSIDSNTYAIASTYSFVPYTGATMSVDLNTQTLNAGTITAYKTAVSAENGIYTANFSTTGRSSVGALNESGTCSVYMLQSNSAGTALGYTPNGGYLLSNGTVLGIGTLLNAPLEFYTNGKTSSRASISPTGVFEILTPKLGTASTTGYVWTATDAIGNGSWQAASGGGSSSTITLSGEAIGTGATAISVTISNSAVIAKVLTGYTASAGTVSATDSIFSAIQKIDGNVALITPTVGSSTLISGSKVVTSSKVTSTCKIFITGKGNGGNLGFLYEVKASRINSTSFVVTSSNILDTQDFDWFITE